MLNSTWLRTRHSGEQRYRHDGVFIFFRFQSTLFHDEPSRWRVLSGFPMQTNYLTIPFMPFWSNIRTILAYQPQWKQELISVLAGSVVSFHCLLCCFSTPRSISTIERFDCVDGRPKNWRRMKFEASTRKGAERVTETDESCMMHGRYISRRRRRGCRERLIGRMSNLETRRLGSGEQYSSEFILLITHVYLLSMHLLLVST